MDIVHSGSAFRLTSTGRDEDSRLDRFLRDWFERTGTVLFLRLVLVPIGPPSGRNEMAVVHASEEVNNRGLDALKEPKGHSS
jgi:hypothetical protein